jgi:hypothetical protein
MKAMILAAFVTLSLGMGVAAVAQGLPTGLAEQYYQTDSSAKHTGR